MQLSARAIKMLKILLERDDYITVLSFAQLADISRRTVFRELKGLEAVLKEYDLQVETRKGKGIALMGFEENKDSLRLYLKAHSHGFLDRKERQQLLTLELLKSKELQKLFYYADKLKVSEATISNDLDCIEPWFQKHSLIIQRTPGVGIELIGEEEAYRKAIGDILYESLQESYTGGNEETLLDEIFFQTREHSILHLLNQTILKRVLSVFRENRKELLLFRYAQSSYVGLIIHLTVAIDRILKQEEISGNEDIMKLVIQDPCYERAKQMAKLLEQEFSIHIPQAEVAFIAMHLKGAKLRTVQDMDDSVSEQGKDRMQILTLIYKMIDVFDPAGEYHLKKDEEFIQGLYAHLRPTLVRLQHHLPIHNPLLSQLQELYAATFEKTKKTSDVFEQTLGYGLPDAEIGFIAMHFGAAIERQKFAVTSSRIVKVGVICSSGIGTSSLLSARIKSIFKSKVEVQSLSVSELPSQEPHLDLLVSTFAIEVYHKPFLIVNPLLGKQDIDSLEHLIASVPITKKQLTERSVSSFTRQLQDLHVMTSAMLQITKNFCVAELEPTWSKQDIMEFIGYRIGNSSKSGSKIYHDILEREAIGETLYLPYHFYLLHAQTEGVEEVHFQVYRPRGGTFQVEEMAGIHFLVVMLVPRKAERIVREVMSAVSRGIMEQDDYRNALEYEDETEIKNHLEQVLVQFLEEYLYES